MSVLKKALTFAAIVTTTFGGAASALTYSFTGTNQPFSISEQYRLGGGVTLEVTAGTFSAISNPSTINFALRFVDQDPDGLGVAFPFIDGDQIDGNAGNDVLVFRFNREVTIDTIFFGNVDRNDDFAFGTVVGSTFGRIVNFEDVTRRPFDVSTIAPNDENVGLSFGIGAIGSNDNFTIAGLSVTPSPIPLPATGALLLSALGFAAFGASRRRRKHA